MFEKPANIAAVILFLSDATPEQMLALLLVCLLSHDRGKRNDGAA
ncbi:hypothetical protein [Arthrobacter sp. NPDC089319]